MGTEDTFMLLTPAFLEKGAEKKGVMIGTLMKDKYPYWFGKFEARLTENEERGNKSGYFVGDTMTVADLKFYYGLANYMSGLPGFDGLLKAAPKVAGFYKKMSDDERSRHSMLLLLRDRQRRRPMRRTMYMLSKERASMLPCKLCALIV